jgi:rRNA-processing protein FCF1
MKVLIDTNFFLIPGKFKIDIFGELDALGRPELFTLDLVLSELKILSSRPGRDASHARLGLDLISRKQVAILKSVMKSADEEILRLANEEGFAVCTQDSVLRKKLKQNGIHVITMRQKSMLVME